MSILSNYNGRACHLENYRFYFFSIVQHIVFHPRAFEKALLFLTPKVGGEKSLCV